MSKSLITSGGLYSSLQDPQAIRDFFHGIEESLQQGLKLDQFSSFHKVWTSAELCIGQTCSSNLVLEYQQHLEVLGKSHRSTIRTTMINLPQLQFY